MTAADLILKKALVGSNINSAEWSKIQAAVRDRAFFSSQIESTRILYDMRRLVADVTRMNLSPSEFRREMRSRLETAGYAPKPGEEGTIKDLYTKSRLDVIYRTNRDQARGFIQYKQFTSQAALEEFPANRLVRVKSRRVPRDWNARWLNAAREVNFKGVFRGADKVALKTSPIWTAISRFGHPYPPFDFGSGMGVENVSIDECIKMGFIQPDDPPQKVPETGFNDGLSSAVPMRDDAPEAQRLKDIFGDQIRFDGNTIHFQSGLMGDVFDGKIKKVSLGIGYNGEKTSISSALIKDHVVKHIGINEKRKDSIPLAREDFELLPTLWRNPNRVTKGHSGHDLIELDMLDGSTLCMAFSKAKGPLTVYKKSVGSI